MGSQVSLLLVLVVNSFIPGVGLMLVPERGTVNTIFAVLYLLCGGFGFATAFAFGIGLFIWVPVVIVSTVHAAVAARNHNSQVVASRADLEGRLSQVEQADSGLGDLANY